MSLDRDFFGGTAPPHPGEILRDDILPCVGLSRVKLAAHLGLSPRVLGELLRERRPVTLEIARRLSAAFGSGPHYWLGLQIQHDLWMARATEPLAIKPLTKLAAPRRQNTVLSQ